MKIQRIIRDYPLFEEKSISGTQIKINAVTKFLKSLPLAFEVKQIGASLQNKPIHLVKWGNGSTKILLWGGMHGNEPTATATLCDLCNYLQHHDYQEEAEKLSEKITIYFIPMVNPDGVQKYTRENAQGIDLNRDFLNMESPEAQVLKKIALAIQPKFGFNLHNQETLWSAGHKGFPATLSFLAPPTDEKNSMPKNRKKAMKVISSILPELQSELPNQIGKWDDTYEERAFGDQFQALGIATILIEAGGIMHQPYSKVRLYYFSAILLSLESIAFKKYKKVKRKAYRALPENEKHHVHILIQNITLNTEQVDMALNYTMKLENVRKGLEKKWEIVQIAPKIHKSMFAYAIIEAKNMQLDGVVNEHELADFKLVDGQNVVMAFEKGKLITEQDAQP